MRSSISLLPFVLAGMSLACATPKGATIEEKREYVLRVRDEALIDLYRERPEVESKIEAAPGYGVFSNIGTQLLVLGTGHGFGVVVDNETSDKTFMRMGQLGLGLGIGVQDFRAVFVFHDPEVLARFVDQGWEFSGEADAAAKSGDKGGAVSGAGSFEEAIEVYQFTKAGLALEASIRGTKYWLDDDLNRE